MGYDGGVRNTERSDARTIANKKMRGRRIWSEGGKQEQGMTVRVRGNRFPPWRE